MGGIRRFVQIRTCLIFGFVAINSVGGASCTGRWRSPGAIRDARFDVVCEALPAPRGERVPRYYYPARCPRCTTDRHTADTYNVASVRPQRPLFEALRRESSNPARPAPAAGYPAGRR